jgi:hypothetical protein
MGRLTGGNRIQAKRNGFSQRDGAWAIHQTAAAASGAAAKATASAASGASAVAAA